MVNNIQEQNIQEQIIFKKTIKFAPSNVDVETLEKLMKSMAGKTDEGHRLRTQY